MTEESSCGSVYPRINVVLCSKLCCVQATVAAAGTLVFKAREVEVVVVVSRAERVGGTNPVIYFHSCWREESLF